MATTNSTDVVEEDAGDLQFPKGNNLYDGKKYKKSELNCI